ncbi:MAG: FAD-dependent oxidoreductase, partial [Phycisphaerales bacterium]
YPGLKLRGDELGTTDGFAKGVYIREPRRLVARTIVTEAHVGTEQRRTSGWDKRDPNWGRVQDGGQGWGTSERFVDSVGIGHYMIDLHPSCAGRNNVYVPAAPFRVPMGALIPVRVRNLLAAGKCLGVSHIANGAYRMHHVEWAVGEAAGVLSAFCLGRKTEPQAVHADSARVQEVQRALGDQGARLAWPWEN